MIYVFNLHAIPTKEKMMKIAEDIDDSNRKLRKELTSKVKRIPELIKKRSTELIAADYMREQDVFEDITYEGEMCFIKVNQALIEMEKNPYLGGLRKTFGMLFGAKDTKTACLKALKDYFPNVEFVREMN